MTTLCQQHFNVSKIFELVRIGFSFLFLPGENKTYKIQITPNFLNLYFNTFLLKMITKLVGKCFKTHSKPSILTLFNKFLMGFENFKKY